VIRTLRTAAASGFAWLARLDEESWQRYGDEPQRREPRKDAADTFAQVRFTALDAGDDCRALPSVLIVRDLALRAKFTQSSKSALDINIEDTADALRACPGRKPSVSTRPRGTRRQPDDQRNQKHGD
jgi:hypothetical protein